MFLHHCHCCSGHRHWAGCPRPEIFGTTLLHSAVVESVQCQDTDRIKVQLQTKSLNTKSISKHSSLDSTTLGGKKMKTNNNKSVETTVWFDCTGTEIFAAEELWGVTIQGTLQWNKLGLCSHKKMQTLKKKSTQNLSQCVTWSKTPYNRIQFPDGKPSLKVFFPQHLCKLPPQVFSFTLETINENVLNVFCKCTDKVFTLERVLFQRETMGEKDCRMFLMTLPEQQCMYGKRESYTNRNWRAVNEMG